MERMIRKRKDNSDYEIDRELTGKFAIEKNAEYQDRIAELEEENKKLNIKVASLEGEIKGLNYTIEELHKELDECECSMHFENDEVGFWKREYKRLKKWIKDHCKGYGNLFPEDEMKRQLKKADKKRKKSDLYKDVGLMEEDTLQELRDLGEI